MAGCKKVTKIIVKKRYSTVKSVSVERKLVKDKEESLVNVVMYSQNTNTL